MNGFYACINDEKFDNKEDFEAYMKCQYHIDNRDMLRQQCNKMIEELESSLIERIKLFDKSIKLNITVDKCGYLIEVQKESNEVEL